MRILIVDDDRLVATSLKTIVEAEDDIEVLATGGSGAEAISLYDELNPDVLLMDIRMADMTGLEAGEQILEKHKDAKILYLTTFNDDEYIVKALSIGAKGYIIKQDFDSIVPALRTVFGGQSVFLCDGRCAALAICANRCRIFPMLNRSIFFCPWRVFF